MAHVLVHVLSVCYFRNHFPLFTPWCSTALYCPAHWPMHCVYCMVNHALIALMLHPLQLQGRPPEALPICHLPMKKLCIAEMLIVSNEVTHCTVVLTRLVLSLVGLSLGLDYFQPINRIMQLLTIQVVNCFNHEDLCQFQISCTSTRLLRNYLCSYIWHCSKDKVALSLSCSVTYTHPHPSPPPPPTHWHSNVKMWLYPGAIYTDITGGTNII